MKIRKGWVGNSSTTSFMIYGSAMSKEQGDFLESDNSDDTWDLIQKHNLSVEYYCEYGTETFVGVSWNKIKDDETGAQFKARIENAIKEIFGEDMTFGTHQYAEYNG